MAHFRSLRSTRVHQRAKAIPYTEQVWELTYALEKWVRLPLVNLPGFSGGESIPQPDDVSRSAPAARMLRSHWEPGDGP